MIEKKIGIIDLGSNSIRLVIFKIEQNGRYKELYNLKVIARLANHIEANGNITSEGIQIVIDALKRFEPIVKHHHVSDVKGIATAAIRSAQNKEIILEQIKQETRFDFRVLSGQEEAYYGYLAVVNSTNVTEGITIDIGGGSTEVTYIKDRELIYSHSFPFGALTLKKQFIAGNEPSEAELERLSTFLHDQFSTLRWVKNKKVPVIGIGGSARNLTRLHQSKTNYPLFGLHQYYINPIDIKKINQRLMATPLTERQKLEGLSKDRADIIIPAIEAIYALVDVVNATTFMMSNKGLREGIFFEEILKQLQLKFFPSVANETLFQLSKDYEIDTKHTSHLLHLARVFIKECEVKKVQVFTEEEKEILFKSTKLVQFGEYIDKASSSQHTFYLLTNRSLDGFDHLLRLKIACVASFKSKASLINYLSPYKSLLTEKEVENLELLGSMLKFLNALNHTKRGVVSTITIHQHIQSELNFSITCLGDYTFEEQNALKHKKHLERSLQCKINIHFLLQES